MIMSDLCNKCEGPVGERRHAISCDSFERWHRFHAKILNVGIRSALKCGKSQFLHVDASFVARFGGIFDNKYLYFLDHILNDINFLYHHFNFNFFHIQYVYFVACNKLNTTFLYLKMIRISHFTF